MLHQISEHLLQNRERIDEFFNERSRGLTPLPYLSCDIRNSGRKIGVVDTNHTPEGVDYVIPGNDDSSRAIRLYARGIADAYIEGRNDSLKEIVTGGDEFVELEDAEEEAR